MYGGKKSLCDLQTETVAKRVKSIPAGPHRCRYPGHGLRLYSLRDSAGTGYLWRRKHRPEYEYSEDTRSCLRQVAGCSRLPAEK